jgi:hypothetical protein
MQPAEGGFQHSPQIVDQTIVKNLLSSYTMSNGRLWTSEMPNHKLENDLVKHLAGPLKFVNLGFVKSDLLGNGKLVFGSVNNRPIEEDHVRALYKAFVFEGLLHKDPIPILLQRSWIGNELSSINKTFETENADNLQILTLTDAGQSALENGLIHCLNGRHRERGRKYTLERAEELVGSPSQPKPLDFYGDERMYRNHKRAQKDVEYFPFTIVDIGKHFIHYF